MHTVNLIISSASIVLCLILAFILYCWYQVIKGSHDHVHGYDRYTTTRKRVSE